MATKPKTKKRGKKPAAKGAEALTFERQFVPLELLQAAVLVTAQDDTNPALAGILIRREPRPPKGRPARGQVIATDRVRLFVATFDIDPEGATWLDKRGVVISAEDLKRRLAVLPRSSRAMTSVKVIYAAGAAWVRFSDMGDQVRFRQPVIEAEYPVVDKVIEAAQGAFDGGARPELTPVAFGVAHLRRSMDVARVLGHSPMAQVEAYLAYDGGPTVITFVDCPGAAIWLMPSPRKAGAAALEPDTARLRAAPLRGHVGALRAHLTRTREALSKAKGAEALVLEDKAADYKRRIAQALARVSGKALPAPKATPEPEGQAPAAESKPGTTVVALKPGAGANGGAAQPQA